MALGEHTARALCLRWARWLAVAVLWGLSSFFEILEAIIAQIVRPGLGTAYFGMQGDIWDAQKEMTAAFVGTILMALLASLRQHATSRASR